MRLPVVFLMGATATGKTDLAISLVQLYPNKFTLVSVDSALIYKGMDIGSAKPSHELLQQYPHHLIDILEPHESYSIGKFFNDACIIIDQAHAENKIPIFVGGTIMYFRSFFSLVNDLPQTKPEVREYVNSLIAEHSVESIHDLMAFLDPSSAIKINLRDKQRIGRVIEVYIQTGLAMSELQTDQKISHPYDIKLFAMEDNRQLIHERIALRAHKMITDGFIAEVEKLRLNPLLNIEMPSIRCVGYRQVWEYLDGIIPENELVDRIIFATRQLAKRQITWMRSWPEPITYLPISLDSKLDFNQTTNLILQHQKIILEQVKEFLI